MLVTDIEIDMDMSEKTIIQIETDKREVNDWCTCLVQVETIIQLAWAFF